MIKLFRQEFMPTSKISITKNTKKLLIFSSLLYLLMIILSGAVFASSKVDVMRFWSAEKNSHFYTSSVSESGAVVENYSDNAWKYERAAFRAVSKNSCAGFSPVYRFWSDNYQSHFYTKSTSERNNLQANDPNWSFEGTAYCVASKSDSGAIPVYRFWSDNYLGHFYTTSSQEKQNIQNNNPNWRYEGIAYYVFPVDNSFNAEFARLINGHRSNNGRSTLNFNPTMNTVAQNHSAWMNSNNTLSHDGAGGSKFYERCQDAGTSCDAENIAYTSGSAYSLFTMWRNSAPHNNNMLGSHSELGLGSSGRYHTLVLN